VIVLQEHTPGTPLYTPSRWYTPGKFWYTLGYTIHPVDKHCPKCFSAWVSEPFSKWGGTSARWKEIITKFVVWIGNCDVTSVEIWRHYIYTIWSSKLHYFRQTYTTMKTYRWTTWNSNRLLQRRPRSSASLGLIIRFILTDWIKPFDACVTEISIFCFHSGWHYRCHVRLLCKNKWEILMITSPFSSNVRHREMITPQWRF